MSRRRTYTMSGWSMSDLARAPRAGRVGPAIRNAGWWLLLLLTLVILDDLVFGPIAWGLAQVSPLLAVLVSFGAMWGCSYWLTLRGLDPHPGPVAAALLSRLHLARRSDELTRREASLKDRITSVSVAVPMSLLFGGVVTTLWLHKRELVNDAQVKPVALALTFLYAIEFVLLHAVGGGRLVLEIRSTIG